jgi:hypothetical protein
MDYFIQPQCLKCSLATLHIIKHFVFIQYLGNSMLLVL